METKELVRSLFSKGFTDAEIAAYLGVSTKTVANWSTGKFQARDTKLRKLSILNNAEPQRYGELDLKIDSADGPPDWPGVPMYDIPVSAGNLAMIRDEPMSEAAFLLKIPSYKDCTFGARVSGDSMYPEIRNGDYVICKEVTTLIYGDIYLVVTFDGVETVKYVHPHPEKEDWVNLVAYNKSVPNTPIAKTSIAKLYKVRGVFKAY